MVQVASLRIDLNMQPKLMDSPASPVFIKQNTVRKFLGEGVFGRDGSSLVASDPLSKIKRLCEDEQVFLCPEGCEEGPSPSDVNGVMNIETLGQMYREKGMAHIFITQLCLLLEQPFDQVLTKFKLVTLRTTRSSIIAGICGWMLQDSPERYGSDMGD